MPRHTFDLTDETRKVFNGSAKEIAEEADVSDKYIYGILAGTETDPFAPFRFYYEAALRAGRDVSPYDHRLMIVRSKYAPSSKLSSHVEIAKLVTETADVVRARLTNEPLYNQLVEALEAEKQAKATVDAILDAIHAEKESFNGNRTRFSRDVAKDLIKKRGAA